MSGTALGSSAPTCFQLFGLGTFRMRGYETILKCLDVALQTGYRLIDTAAVYRNEEDIGLALQELLPKYGLTRADLFITSKLGPADQGSKAYEACLQSLKKLQLDYLDLYLIHWPGTQKTKLDDPQNAVYRQESWRMLERLHREGKCKHIGISNYLVRHMEELLTYAEIKPAVNQSEYHPYHLNRDVVEYCQRNGIQFQAYTSLGQGEVISDPTVAAISTRIQRKPCQVALKWAMQDGIGVIPMSTKPEHIVDNCGVWDWTLSEDDMKAIHSIEKKHKYAWDPATVT